MDLANVPLKEINNKKVRYLIHCKVSDTVGSCLSKLGENNIHSLAVYDDEDKEILGFVDYLDLIVHLLNTCVKKMESRVTPPSQNLATDDFELIIKRSNEFHMRSILDSKLINKSGKDPLYEEVPDTKPLWYMGEVFALGLHRGILKDEKGNKTVFTQSDVVSWLSIDTENKLGELSHKSVKELDLGSKDLVTIGQKSPAIDAFFLMKEKNVSGIGIVNDDSELVGNFSSSDLKGIRHFNFSSLLESVQEYISNIRKADKNHKSDVVWVIETTPFSTVIKKFSERRVHRIYVVQPETMKPKSVITLTDVLNKIPMKHK